MTTPADQPTRAGEPGDGTTADEAVVPTGQDMPRSVSFLVFARATAASSSCGDC